MYQGLCDYYSTLKRGLGLGIFDKKRWKRHRNKSNFSKCYFYFYIWRLYFGAVAFIIKGCVHESSPLFIRGGSDVCIRRYWFGTFLEESR